jgi:hypothetical protein
LPVFPAHHDYVNLRCGPPVTRGGGFVDGAVTVYYTSHFGESKSEWVNPKWHCGFHVLPGAGCESLNFDLYEYPKTVRVATYSNHKQYQVVKVGQSAFSSSGFCKTVYAGSPASGGSPENFLKCHLLVCRALEIACELGFKVDVNDESGYYENENLDLLLPQGTSLRRVSELPDGWYQRLDPVLRPNYKFEKPEGPVRRLTRAERANYSGNDYIGFEPYSPEKFPVTGRFWTRSELDLADYDVTHLIDASPGRRAPRILLHNFSKR